MTNPTIHVRLRKYGIGGQKFRAWLPTERSSDCPSDDDGHDTPGRALAAAATTLDAMAWAVAVTPEALNLLWAVPPPDPLERVITLEYAASRWHARFIDDDDPRERRPCGVGATGAMALRAMSIAVDDALAVGAAHAAWAGL